jgi:hypothetical protein
LYSLPHRGQNPLAHIHGPGDVPSLWPWRSAWLGAPPVLRLSGSAHASSWRLHSDSSPDGDNTGELHMESSHGGAVFNQISAPAGCTRTEARRGRR